MLTILRGLPGSGKTYYAQHHFKGALLLEGDQQYMQPDGTFLFRPEVTGGDYVKEMLQTAFINKLPHVVVATSTVHAKNVQMYIDVAKAYNHDVRILWIDYLNGSGTNEHNVQPETIEWMKDHWEHVPGEDFALRIHDADGYHTFCKYKISDRPPLWFRQRHPDLYQPAE